MIHELQVEPERRTEESLLILAEAAGHLPFFKKLLEDDSENFKATLPSLCEKITKVEVKAGKHVMRVGRLV